MLKQYLNWRTGTLLLIVGLLSACQTAPIRDNDVDLTGARHAPAEEVDYIGTCQENRGCIGRAQELAALSDGGITLNGAAKIAMGEIIQERRALEREQELEAAIEGVLAKRKAAKPPAKPKATAPKKAKPPARMSTNLEEHCFEGAGRYGAAKKGVVQWGNDKRTAFEAVGGCGSGIDLDKFAGPNVAVSKAENDKAMAGIAGSGSSHIIAPQATQGSGAPDPGDRLQELMKSN